MSTAPKIGDGEGAIPERVVYEVGQCDALSPTTKYIALAMLAYTGLGNPKARVGQKRIANVTGVNQGQVSKAVKDLVREGIIEIVQPGAGKRPSVIRFNHWPSDEADDADQSRPAKKHRPTSEQFDLAAQIDSIAKSTKDTRQSEDSVADILKAGGLKGSNLKSMARHPEMTAAMARSLVEHAETADNPGGFMFKAWSNGWRGENTQRSDTSPTSPDWFTPTADSAEVHRRMLAEKVGLTLEQFDVYQEQQRSYVEANPGITPEQAGINADELVARIKAGDFDG